MRIIIKKIIKKKKKKRNEKFKLIIDNLKYNKIKRIFFYNYYYYCYKHMFK